MLQIVQLAQEHPLWIVAEEVLKAILWFLFNFNDQLNRLAIN